MKAWYTTKEVMDVLGYECLQRVSELFKDGSLPKSQWKKRGKVLVSGAALKKFMMTRTKNSNLLDL